MKRNFAGSSLNLLIAGLTALMCDASFLRAETVTSTPSVTESVRSYLDSVRTEFMTGRFQCALPGPSKESAKEDRCADNTSPDPFAPYRYPEAPPGDDFWDDLIGQCEEWKRTAPPEERERVPDCRAWVELIKCSYNSGYFQALLTYLECMANWTPDRTSLKCDVYRDGCESAREAFRQATNRLRACVGDGPLDSQDLNELTWKICRKIRPPEEWKFQSTTAPDWNESSQ